MDEPIRYFVTEGAGETIVHPVGLAILVLCGFLFLALPRRYALWPFLAMVCFVSHRQCVAFGSLNIYFDRIFYLVLLPARVLLRGEGREFRLNVLDWSVVAYALFYFLAGSINWSLDLSEVKTRSGYTVDIVGSYFIFRLLTRDVTEVRSLILCLACIAIPLLGFFCVEYSTGRNLFSIFGGVPEITAIREGRLRCQGAFAHPIMAGVIWASFIPLLAYGVLTIRRYRWLMGSAVCASLGIVFLCASSTPVLGIACAFLGLCLYPWRRHARLAFAGTAALLVVMHAGMQAPIWHLIARINLTGGDSGYHRYVLVDGFIRHWDEWWFLGTKVGTAHWGHFSFDTANQFVQVGVNSGIGLLGIFAGLIVIALLTAGRIGRQRPFLGWALGVTVMVHCVCFLGLSIWQQYHVAWSLPLAMIGSLGYAGSASKAAAAKPERRLRRRPQGLAATCEPVRPGIPQSQSLSGLDES